MAFGMWKKNRHTVKKHEREAKEGQEDQGIII